jgi:hypothetical protein
MKPRKATAVLAVLAATWLVAGCNEPEIPTEPEVGGATQPIGKVPEEAVTANGVNPVFVDGNPNCATLNADDTNFPGLTSDFGFKVEGEAPNGPYTFTDADGTLTGGAPEDASNWVKISESDGTTFTWEASLGIDAVIVKSKGANVWVYVPESKGDAGLYSPDNKDISHVEFCYDYELSVTKTADGSYDEIHTWNVEKSVDPADQMGFPGGELSWTWTVDVFEVSADDNFLVSGDIKVTNPFPVAVEVTVTDMLDDGTSASVTCDDDNVVTVPAQDSYTCTYTASPGDASATKNTATVTAEGYDEATAEDDVEWTKTVINATATIDDDQEPGFPLTLSAGEGPWKWTETQTHTCASDASAYVADGMYSATVDNTAILKAGETILDQSRASTTYTCKAGFVSLLKLFGPLGGAAPDPTTDIKFKIYVGADGFGSIPVVAEDSTKNDADGILEFGNPALRPDGSETAYTICELSVPAGWEAEWKINGTAVTPYNPDFDPDPEFNEDLGNRCVDFGYETDFVLDVGATMAFEVTNVPPPLGTPRTPGYWKNWNKCTGGNQEYTAAKNGGIAEGWYLLDDLLPVIWGPIVDQGFSFTIDSCADGVSILDRRDLSSGSKRANDAAYNLASHLLAAQLNFAAGAETCAEATGAAAAGEILLVEIGFDGDDPHLSPDHPRYQNALDLAFTLDEYNNGNLYLCP